jgi:hypothetical protein
VTFFKCKEIRSNFFFQSTPRSSKFEFNWQLFLLELLTVLEGLIFPSLLMKVFPSSLCALLHQQEPRAGSLHLT